MAAVLEVVAPVFLLVALGWAAARWRILDEAAFRGLTLFVFGLASPALLFAGGSKPHEGGAGAALALVGGSVILYAICVVGARRIARMNLADAALFGLACVFGNSVMMGIPIIVAAYGEPGVPPLLAILALQTMVLLGIATMLTEVGLHASASWKRVLRATAKGVLRNPVLLAVIAALVWSSFALPVPGVARRTLELVGAASPPVALFCLGGSLYGLGIASAWRETLAIASLKLLALPVLVFALAQILALTPVETAVAVTMAALPTGATAFVVARRYATGADRSGSAVVLTTALSVLTLSVLIGHFRATLH
ncbi:AEC family transporter [Falsiroseomonas oryziterrae]|uniref:AEC family transporter n=1 Tax=Falsiroseomonas oryziterrae TaxID=2911368 RepID=UPI001F19B4C0|nr:AEC family transporter [Roseomonas sp. NPKOSM-4]